MARYYMELTTHDELEEFGIIEPEITPVHGDTLKEMHRAFIDYRNACGLGASSFGPITIYENGRPLAEFSYNGRLWDTTGKEIFI